MSTKNSWENKSYNDVMPKFCLVVRFYVIVEYARASSSITPRKIEIVKICLCTQAELGKATT